MLNKSSVIQSKLLFYYYKWKIKGGAKYGDQTWVEVYGIMWLYVILFGHGIVFTISEHKGRQQDVELQ